MCDIYIVTHMLPYSASKISISLALINIINVVPKIKCKKVPPGRS